MGVDKSYNEYGLPNYLTESIKTYTENTNAMIADCLYCELQTDINLAETGEEITQEQAWYLREKYLHISRTEI